MAAWACVSRWRRAALTEILRTMDAIADLGWLADLDWLGGALAGALAALVGSEVLARRRHRRAVDGAALDHARLTLEPLQWIGIRLARAEDYDEEINVMGEIVTAELRDRIGVAAESIDTRVRDAPLSELMHEIHEKTQMARKAARDYDAAPKSADAQAESSVLHRRTLAFDEANESVQIAREIANKAFERIADLERDRPRR